MAKHQARVSDREALAAPWEGGAASLRVLAAPAALCVPLAARAGSAPAKPLPPGTEVSRGQVISLTAETGAAVRAPLAGRLGDIRQVRLLNGERVPAIELTVDQQRAAGENPETSPTDCESAGTADDSTASDAAAPPAGAPLPPTATDRLMWIEHLRASGVWADRRGSPDLLGQLDSLSNGDVDTVLCNLLDEEPRTPLNSMLAGWFPAELMRGVRLLGRMTGARNVWIAVDDMVPSRWWGPLRQRDRKPRIDLIPITNDYPQSDPVLLIHGLLGRHMQPGQLPTRQRVIAVDAAAAIAIGHAACEHHMLQAPVGVRDHVRSETHMLLVPVGTSVRDVLGQIGAKVDDDISILRGGLLHENTVEMNDVVAGGELTLHLMARTPGAISDPCIRCSWCVEACPTRVQPAGALEAAQRNDLGLGRGYGLHACIECGVCNYVCPSHLPLLSGIRKLRELEESERRSR